MAAVRIEDQAFADLRFEVLGRLSGFNRYEALGRMAYLWRLCTERNSPVVSEAMADAILGEGGSRALVGAMLAEPAGVGFLRVRGTTGRIEWLEKLRQSARSGGLARASRALSASSSARLDSQAPAKRELEQELKQDSSKTQRSYSYSSEISGSQDLRIDLTPLTQEHRPPKRAKPGRKRAEDFSPADREAARLVLSKLSRWTGIEYRGSAAHTGLIAARLRDGLTVDDLRKVILYCADPAAMGWSTDEKMALYLRPETLFGPVTIERYLDAARAYWRKHFGELTPDEAAARKAGPK